jgi:hypothetical protein
VTRPAPIAGAVNRMVPGVIPCTSQQRFYIQGMGAAAVTG